MLKGFDPVPYSPSKAYRAEAGEDDAAIDDSIGPADKGVFVNKVKVQVLEDGRHHKTHNKGQYG